MNRVVFQIEKDCVVDMAEHGLDAWAEARAAVKQQFPDGAVVTETIEVSDEPNMERRVFRSE